MKLKGALRLLKWINFILSFYFFREDQETVLHSKDPFAPVAYLKFHKLRLAHRVWVPTSHFHIVFPLLKCGINFLLLLCNQDDSELSANYDGIRSPQDFCKLELKYVLESAPRNMIARNSTHLSEATELLAKTNCYRTNSGVIFLNCLPVESEDNLPVAMEKFKGRIPVVDCSNTLH